MMYIYIYYYLFSATDAREPKNVWIGKIQELKFNLENKFLLWKWTIDFLIVKFLT